MTAARPHVVRIYSKACSSYGWQARAPYTSRRYVSRFFADRKHGGTRKAKRLAQAELPLLALEARYRQRASAEFRGGPAAAASHSTGRP